MLADAYTQGWASLFHPHTGYLQTLPRLVALFAVGFPLALAPNIFILAGTLIQMVPVAMLLSARGAMLMPSMAARLALTAFYIGVPNSFETYLYLTDAQ